MTMKIPTIKTERLLLRAFNATDIDPMFDLLNGEGVLHYFPKSDPPDRERVARMVANLLAHWEARDYGLWAVESQLNGELMGRCGLQFLPETGEVEVDFILGRDYWGQGYATEAGQVSLKFGFGELNLDSIVGIVHPENMASRRVLEKIGMRLMERTQYFGMDVFRYLITRSQFAAE